MCLIWNKCSYIPVEIKKGENHDNQMKKNKEIFFFWISEDFKVNFHYGKKVVFLTVKVFNWKVSETYLKNNLLYILMHKIFMKSFLSEKWGIVMCRIDLSNRSMKM